MRQEQIIKNFSTDQLNDIELIRLLSHLECERKIKRKSYNDEIFWMID